MTFARRLCPIVLALVAVAGYASGGNPTVARSPAPAGAATSPGREIPAWHRIDTSGPIARRDHTLTADPETGLRYLFGGRAKGKQLDDLWSFDPARTRWSRIHAPGPSPRFGHNAAFLAGDLVVFGGQGAPGRFFNDLWSFDPPTSRWKNATPPGVKPAPRYGAGATTIPRRLLVTHGFTDGGRFDDTWSFGQKGWSDVSPSSGRRPVKRCLTRAVYLAQARRVLMFGGQTTRTPFLGDTWLFEPILGTWTEVVQGTCPSPRNLYAAAAVAKDAYLFGGFGPDGPLDDLWAFGGRRWRELRLAGPAPSPRGGIEAAASGSRIYVFGGANDSGELADLWALTPPG